MSKEIKAEIVRLMREEFDPQPPNYGGYSWHDCAEEVADSIIALFARAEAAEARATTAEAQVVAMGEAGIGCVSALAAAISLLERAPAARKAAPSDRMFACMLDDYRKALETARAALSDTHNARTAEDRSHD